MKGYPFEVAIAGATLGVVLFNQVKSLDWRARQAKRKRTMADADLAAVRSKAITLMRGV